MSKPVVRDVLPALVVWFAVFLFCGVITIFALLIVTAAAGGLGAFTHLAAFFGGGLSFAVATYCAIQT